MPNAITPFEALKIALDRAGSQIALAKTCGVGQPAVSKWLQSSKRLPVDYVLAVESATGVSRHLLRPDIYPLSDAAQGEDPGEECGTILSATPPPVACDRRDKAQRKDVA